MTPPISLQNYFVTEQHCTANRSFRAQESVPLKASEFAAEPVLSRLTQQGENMWQLILTIKYTPAETTNAPYSFRLVLVGIFEVAAGIPADSIERIVRGNGASMLFGIARECVRVMTGAGPFGAMLLPTVSFFEPAKKPAPLPPPARVSAIEATAANQPAKP